MIPIIDANKIKFTATGRSLPILQEMDLKIFSGEFVILLGHNGSGKSSLTKILSGEILPTSGKILIDQVPLINMNSIKRAQDIITLTQATDNRLFVNLTVEENIIPWESRFPSSERLKALDFLESIYSKEKAREILKQSVGYLSGGEKQMIITHLALAHPPKILFLDEYTSALDPKASNRILDFTARLISKHHITTLMITHKLEEALNYGTRLIIMSEGKVISDRPKSSSWSAQDLKAMIETNY